MEPTIESKEDTMESTTNNEQQVLNDDLESSVNNEIDNVITTATDNSSAINKIETMEAESETINTVNSSDIGEIEKTETVQSESTNDECEIEKSESPLINEHSYASVLAETDNGLLTSSKVSDSVLQMEILDDVDVTNDAKNINNLDVLAIDSDLLVIDNEVEIEDVSVVDQKAAANKTNSELFYIDKQNPLEALALQYDSSDSENESDPKKTTEVSNNQDYRTKDEVVLSSDQSSDSESDSSSSSDSDSDSDSSSPKINNSVDSENDDDDDDSRVKNKNGKQKKFVKPKGEFDNLPPIEDLKISVPEVLCDPLGEVAWTVNQLVVVKPKPGTPTLNIDTVLFIDKGQRALGHIFDVFGQVTEPHYCVRFNSSEHIQESDIKVGMTVYYCPNTPYTSLVFLAELKKVKAADEVDEDEPPEFSDDEEEQAYYASLKEKNRNNAKTSNNEVPNKRRRGNKSGWQSNHPWNSRKDNAQQNLFPQEPKPFYRTHHPWSRPRYQQQNPRHWQNNPQPNNQWMPPSPYYNNMQAYNSYIDPRQMSQPPPMPNAMYPQMQWNPYQIAPVNTVPVQAFSADGITPFILTPPPPPPIAPTTPSTQSNANN